MSKALRYTLVGEGFAEYEFIPAYMRWAAQQIGGLTISRSNIQIAISKNPSVSKVLQEAATLCVRSFADERNPSQLFIAGIDLDEPDHTDEQAHHAKRVKELERSMGKVYRQYKDVIILYVPVQTIDCWVYYAQTGATANSLESVSKNDTKAQVYGTSKPDRQRIERTVREAATKADFVRLAKQSRSFRQFHEQVTTFLNNYKTTSQ